MQKSQWGFFISHQHHAKVKPQKKKCFFNRFLSRCFEKNRCWHGRCQVKMKVTRKLQGKILNWFVGLDVGKIFPPKYVLFLACNRTGGCSWTVKYNLRSRLKKKKKKGKKNAIYFTLAKLSGLKYKWKFQLNYKYVFNITWNTVMIDYDYYRNSANEAIKATKLPWE